MIDSFTRHEALHMALFLGEAVESQLLENPFVKNDKDCAALAEKAHGALLELYQLIGSKNL